MAETDRRSAQQRPDTRIMLDAVGDKWSLLVVCQLKDGPRRFGELKKNIGRVNQKSLTVALRALERDGIVSRNVHSLMPPHVTYELTALGVGLYDATTPLLEWTIENRPRIDEARNAYDTRHRHAADVWHGTPSP